MSITAERSGGEMKNSLLIAMVAALLSGCSQEPNRDAESETPGRITITKHDPSAEPEDWDDESVFVPVEDDESDIDIVSDDLIDISIEDAPMIDVVRMFTRISGANIIASPANLQGRVTANLQGVHWQSALETILDMHNLSLIESPPGSGIFRIDPKIPGQPEPMTVEVYYVDSAKEAIEIAGALEEALGICSSLRIAAVPSRKSILVNGASYSHQQVRDIMDRIEFERDE
jgi:type II secretory pathway component GspD/PulD (secretin)